MRFSPLLLWLIIMTTNPSKGQSVQVMSYNLRYDNPGDGINAWPLRKDKVAQLIKKYDPDFIGVQEALYHQLHDLIDLLPEYAFLGVGRDDGKEGGEFSAILYKKKKFDISENHTFWLSETPDVAGSKSWDAAITRVVTWARVKDVASGNQFFMMNTHFDHIGKLARKNSALQIVEAVRRLRGDLEIPLILTGDFNSQRNEPPYQELVAATPPLLIDSKPATDTTGTYCGFEVGAMTCVPIDYIFYTGEWNPANYQVIQDHDGKNYPSDHLPVMVTLTLAH